MAFATFSVTYNLPQNRLQLSFTLLLTAVTFKWVVVRCLPTISYLTTLVTFWKFSEVREDRRCSSRLGQVRSSFDGDALRGLCVACDHRCLSDTRRSVLGHFGVDHSRCDLHSLPFDFLLLDVFRGKQNRRSPTSLPPALLDVSSATSDETKRQRVSGE